MGTAAVLGGAGGTRTNCLPGCSGCLSSESASNARNNDDYTYTYTWLYILIHSCYKKLEERIKMWRKTKTNKQQRDRDVDFNAAFISPRCPTLRPRQDPSLLPSLANHLEEPINGPLIASLCLGSRVWSQLMLMLINKTELSQPRLPNGLVLSLHMPRKLCQGSRKNILNWNSVYRADKIVPEYTPAYPKSRTRCRPLPTSCPSLHFLLGPTTWPGFASHFGGNSIKWKMMLIVNVICSRGLHKSAKKTENWLLIGTARKREGQRKR